MAHYLKLLSPLCLSLLVCQASAETRSPKIQEVAPKIYKSFTGRILGSNVRLRTAPDVESPIVKEIPKGDLFVVVGEDHDFYAVQPPSDLKAYIFRSFVLDNIVEGNRVNIRLEPDLESPIISHMSSGSRIDGKISDKNNKWLEITPPQSTQFYVAKEFVEFAGGPEYKISYDRRLSTLKQLKESALLLTQSELRKPFEEMDVTRIVKNYQTIIDDYSEFKNDVEEAKQLLNNVQETFLQRKIAYLEAKASRMINTHKRNENKKALAQKETEKEEEMSATDRMLIWEPVEEALFKTWLSMHHAKSFDDYYVDQKLKSFSITGILEAYVDPVKNKPGDYILKDNSLPIAYVYSTHINLDDYVGKRVNLHVTERSNNNFAFPAFFVLDAD